jgi:serine/threonine-protein kinase
VRQLGRYALHDEIASGGMATVCLARQRGEVGFARVVAVKVLHAQYAKEESFRAMFLDEARIVSRIRHPNVVATLDVLESDGELFLVMEYVHGESLGRLLKTAATRGVTIPTSVAVAIAIDTLEGLHAAHEATSEDGTPLDIVHRDISPQNLIVGVDGVTHVADFGIAKAVGRLAEKFSVENTVKGKAGYMAPEQLRGNSDRRADVFALGVVLWEMLAMRRLFSGESFMAIVTKAMDAEIEPIARVRPDVSAALSDVVAKALERDPSRRFSSAREMVARLEECRPRASAREVSEWMRDLAREALDRRSAQITRIEMDRTSASANAPPADAIDSSVSGVEPVAKAPRAPARGWAVIAGVMIMVITSTVVAITRHTTPRTQQLVTSSSTATTATATASVSASPIASASVIVNEIVSSTAKPHPTHITSPAPMHHVNMEPRDAGDCHWEQLPDSQGILIPKKICP